MRGVARLGWLVVCVLVFAGCASPSVEPSTTTLVTTTPSSHATTPTPSSPTTTTHSPPSATTTTTTTTTPSAHPTHQPPQFSPTPCEGTGTVALNTSPMRLDDFRTLLPYGLMVGGHVTPIDHMYFAPTNMPGVRDEYDVFAIADGQIVEITTRPSLHPPGSTPQSVEYRIWIDHTCTFHSYFDLVTSLSPRVLAWYEQPSPRDRLPIQAGELVGKIGGQTLDFGVYNDDVVLPGLLVPEHYERENWKIHTDDPFLYYTEPVRSQLLAKSVRLAEPRSGKIDHDIAGRAIGNWFQVGTNGYAGSDPRAMEYWSGHLALAPDPYFPDHLLASLGNYSGQARQFAIKNNGPNYANVTPETGLVKYELVMWDYKDLDNPAAGQFHAFPRPIARPAWVNGAEVSGTLLIQMTSPHTLKAESFPGKKAEEVAAFTTNAKEYER